MCKHNGNYHSPFVSLYNPFSKVRQERAKETSVRKEGRRPERRTREGWRGDVGRRVETGVVGGRRRDYSTKAL